tara:strand:- start:4330 stop:5553 length:1224 start_codon:yes stop_codon:yes gene_type:complete
MKVLMFGWEFPPFNSGGLGTACHGLTKGLTSHGVDVTFVLPKAPEDAHADHVKLLVANNLKFVKNLKIKEVNSLITEYITSDVYDDKFFKYVNHIKGKHGTLYGEDLHHEVYRFSEIAKLLSKEEDFDVIHAHDWMTYQAGMNAKKETGKPLVVHMHATEFDRTGGHNVNEYVYSIEKQGMEEADKVLAVSAFTKSKIIEHYGINPDKIEVVHNAVEFTEKPPIEKITSNDKVVLFLGRITIQKGPDWFLYAARRVLDKMDNVKFIIAGQGDMEPMIIEKAAELGMADKVLFTGFLRGKEIDKAYAMADLYVMPSVSEPFGITPLESMRNGTPTLISKQSGVSEVLTHCLKADFWNVDDMASKMLSVLQYDALHETLQENGSHEVSKFDWKIPAKKCMEAYLKVVSG